MGLTKGSQAGADRQARGERPGHRLDRGPGGDAHAAHQRADGAPPDAPEGPLLRRGLLKLVGRRRRFLDYMQRKDLEGYRALIKELGLRR